MDKQTLSNYGWLVIVTLILAVMLALATPFGNYVGDAVVNVANGFVGTNNDATADENISQDSVEWAIKTDYGIDYNKYYYFSNMKQVETAINSNNYSAGTSKMLNKNIVVAIGSSYPVVRLLHNINLNENITFKKGLILDFYGHSINMNNLSNGLEINVINEDIVVTSLQSQGLIKSTNCIRNLTVINQNGNSTIKNIDISNKSDVEIDGNYKGLAIGSRSSDVSGMTNSASIENCHININSTNMADALIIQKIKNLSIKNSSFITTNINFAGSFIQEIENGKIENTVFDTTTLVNKSDVSDANIILKNTMCNTSHINFNNCTFNYDVSTTNNEILYGNIIFHHNGDTGVEKRYKC